jgi:hypothetical protein
MMDIESAIWGGDKVVFTGVKLQGCNFHWTQAKELQVSPAYKKITNSFSRSRKSSGKKYCL